MKKSLAAFLIVSLFSAPAWCYLSILNSADVPNSSQAGLQFQSITAEGGGALFNGFYEVPYSDEMAARYSFGLGEFDFNAGAVLKWTPFPDTKTQPAVGFRAAFWYAKEASTSITTTQLAAMLSKRFNEDFGSFTPFGALALNFSNVSGGGASGSANSTQLSIGSELHHKNVENMFFTGEIGMSIKDATSFIAVAVIVPMEGDKAFFKRRK